MKMVFIGVAVERWGGDLHAQGTFGSIWRHFWLLCLKGEGAPGIQWVEAKDAA